MFIKEVGMYSLDVMWDGEILGSHRLTVKKIDEQTQGEQDHG
jgi:hypothetical protein